MHSLEAAASGRHSWRGTILRLTTARPLGCGTADGRRTGHDQRQTDEGLDRQPFAEYRRAQEDRDHWKEERHEGAAGGANAPDDDEIQNRTGFSGDRFV